jgi:D-amino peptidase
MFTGDVNACVCSLFDSGATDVLVNEAHAWARLLIRQAQAHVHDAEPASEGRLNAALAAENGVPVLMVTGDDRTCAD